ncbi:hypothetical protein BKA64DRAFT_712128 [Cadophora sp. MPI-SDFR-AT-0126]|nr:hypothetical protein BKA64DRAFT_712128 [Leotiomycetes sp. MPI-SDFR-AT-0126]
MARHVPTRDRDIAINSVGDPSSHRHHTQEYNFPPNGEDSVPRTSAPLYISPRGTRISHGLQDNQLSNPLDTSCHGGDYGSNYTFGAENAGDTGAALARAIQALTLGYAEEEASSDYNGESTAYENNLLERGADGQNSKGPNTIHGHRYGSGINVAATTPSQNSGIQHRANKPRAATSLVPEVKENIHLDDNSGSLSDGELDYDTQYRDKEPTHINPIVERLGWFTEQSLNDGTLDDKSDRESYFLGLGTWHSTDPEAPADILRSFAKTSSTSGIDPAFRSCDSFKPSFTQCAAEGSGSSSSGKQGRQGRQSLSAASNASWNHQGQFSPETWKGKRPTGAGDDEDGEDEQDKKRFKGDDTPSKTPVQKLACPFQKHDAVDFSSNGTTGRYRSCTGAGFPTIARLKEHLYRCHLEFTCARCQNTFPDQEQLDDHYREGICEQRPKRTWGITSAVEKQLRKKTTVSDPKSKWYEIYQMIFPSGSLPPSPYYRPGSSEGFQEYIESHLPEALNASLDPILDDWPCTREQKSSLKEAITKCYRNLWISFRSPKEPEKSTPSDSNDSVGEPLHLSETPPSLRGQAAVHEPANEPLRYQTSRYTVSTQSDPTLSSSLFPNYPPPEPRGGPTSVHERPFTPQRGNSHWSDSGFASSSNCDHCNDGKCVRCLAPMSPVSRNTSTSHNMAGPMPGVSNPTSPFDNVYDQNLESFLSESSSKDFEELFGSQIQNYCGQLADFPSPQPGPR